MPIVSHPFGAIPAELRDLKRWTCWQESTKGKPPIQATVAFNGRHVYARADDPATWAPFDVAHRYWENDLSEAGVPSGLSFALNGDGIIGIDLDDCRNPKNKSISQWAVKIIKRFASYTEISPSGNGIRIFLRGKLPPGHRCKIGKIEVYSTDKFLTVTGRRIASHGTGSAIEDRMDELLAWHREVFGDAPSTKIPQEKIEGIHGLVLNTAPTIDEAKLEELFRKKPRTRDVFQGRKHYGSQSEADQALSNYAVNAGWTDQEVCDLLVYFREISSAEHDKPLAYFARTIAKSREAQERRRENAKNRKSDRGGAVPGGADNPVPVSSDDQGGSRQCEDAENRKSDQGGAMPEGAESAGVPSVVRVKPITIREAREVFKKWLYLKDPNLVDVLLSVPAGNTLLESDSLWLFLKGPPGSGKTEALNALRHHPSTLFVSNLTPAALISGYVDPLGDQSLLPQLDGKTLVIKDFTSILSMNPTTRDEVFGILRDAYDGHAAKNFGTGRREYDSRFNLVAGVTSAIEGTWHLSQLGERFLVWAMDADDPLGQARRAMANAEHEKIMREELAAAAAGVLTGLPSVVPEVPKSIEDKTLPLAYLLARLRTYVARDRNDVVHRAPEVEVPTRITKQLLRLGRSVASVRHKECLTEDEFAVMRKVALDSVPAARKAMFLELVDLRRSKTDAPVDYFAKECRISHSPAKRHLDDLVLLGVAKGREGVNRTLHYTLTNEVFQQWGQVKGQAGARH